jgi:hypothetical protein
MPESNVLKNSRYCGRNPVQNIGACQRSLPQSGVRALTSHNMLLPVRSRGVGSSRRSRFSANDRGRYSSAMDYGAPWRAHVTLCGPAASISPDLATSKVAKPCIPLRVKGAAG